jgi:RHS repeat-associated protein
VVERLSYDAWGKRRFPNGTDDPTGSITSETTRGFTGEEELSVSGLVHLNGRVYDPLLARFTSADTITENPLSTQGWNRYSYVGNDPLAYTDPSGHCFLGCFWQHISSAVSSAWNAVTNFVAHNVIVRAIVQFAIAVAITAATGNVVLAAAASSAITTGLSGGNFGQILKAGAIAGATAFAFGGLNVLAPVQAFGATFDPVAYAENVAGSALVGCASYAASGGSCGSGAAAAAVTAGLAPVTNGLFPDAPSNLGQRFGGTIVQATAGGLASVAGGGKFANGAATGAFAYNVALGPVSGTTDSRMDANDADFRPDAVQHILDRHGDPFAQSLDPRAGQFTQEYSNPAALNQLADQVIGSPDASVAGNGANTLYFGAVFWRDNDTGRTYPALVGMTGAYAGRPSMPTNLVAVVVNPAGQVVTMFPTDNSYAASKGAILP